MKIKNTIQLISLLLCSITSQLWGMKQVEAPRPEQAPSSTGTHTELITKEYLKEQSLLRLNQTGHQTSSAPQKKPTIFTSLYNLFRPKPKPTATPVDVTIDSSTQNLTEADHLQAIKRINAQHQSLDSQQPIVTKTVMDIGKKTFLLEQVFKEELKKRDPSLTEPDIDLLVKKLKNTILMQFRNDNTDESKFDAIRKEMIRLITTAKTEFALIESKKVLADTPQQAAPQAPGELVTQTPLAVTKPTVPFREKGTQLALTIFQNAVLFLREPKQELTTDEQIQINKIIEKLNNALPKKPDARDLLFRKKWSKGQEDKARTALKTASEELATFSARRTEKAKFVTEAEMIVDEFIKELSDDQRSKAPNFFNATVAKASRIIDSGKSEQLPELLKQLKNDLNLVHTRNQTNTNTKTKNKKLK